MQRVVVLDAGSVVWLAHRPQSHAILHKAVHGGRLHVLVPAAARHKVEATPDAGARARQLQLIRLMQTVDAPGVAAAFDELATLVTPTDGSSPNTKLIQLARAAGCSVIGPAELLEHLSGSLGRE